MLLVNLLLILLLLCPNGVLVYDHNNWTFLVMMPPSQLPATETCNVTSKIESLFVIDKIFVLNVKQFGKRKHETISTQVDALAHRACMSVGPVTYCHIEY